MLECQPQRSLAAHADPQQADAARPQAPALGEVRQNLIDDVALGRHRRVEFAAHVVQPPRLLAVRTDASQLQFCEQLREAKAVSEGFAVLVVQEKDAKARPALRLEYIGR